MFSSVCGAKKSATSPLEAFLLFFDDEMLEMIVAETSRYAEQKIISQSWKPRSRVNSWVPVDKNEIYVYLGLIMLMGIVQNPSIKHIPARIQYWTHQSSVKHCQKIVSN
jgi:hypothetical protein